MQPISHRQAYDPLNRPAAPEATRSRASITCLLLAFALAAGSRAGRAAPNELSPDEKAAGWQLLWDGKTTTGWHSYNKDTFPASGWEVTNGWLHCLGKKGGDLLSQKEFEQFELEWKWKQAPGGNSGVKYFVLPTRKTALGHEYQMIDDATNPDASLADGKRVTASFYDVLKPTKKTRPKPPGQVNQSRVVVSGNHVEHWLNGDKVLEYDCGSDALKAAIAQSKFKNASGFGDRVKGQILLQDHESEVWFQDVKIRELPLALGRGGGKP